MVLLFSLSIAFSQLKTILSPELFAVLKQQTETFIDLNNFIDLDCWPQISDIAAI